MEVSIRMPDVILFHHSHGRTSGVLAFAAQLRDAGHRVVVPDLYDGAVFGGIDEGVAYAEERGFDNLIAAGVSAAEAHPAEVVYAGFSLGALVALKLAQTRSGAVGALLYHHGDVPITTFGESWPESVDLQIHVSEYDEWVEPDTVGRFIDVARRSAQADLFVYPGSSHLFADSSLPDYDRDFSGLVLRRTVNFLDSHR